MNMMDSVLALLAVMFFTTVSMVYNRAMWTQYDNLNNATLVVQASQLCHSTLDEVDAKLFSKKVSFNNVNINYNFTRTVAYAHLNTTFTVVAVATDCDSLGVMLAVPPENNQFKSVRVTVSGPAALRHSVSLRRLYTKTSMYL